MKNYSLTLMQQADAAISAVERLINDIQMPRPGEIGIGEVKFEAVINQMALDAIESGSPANNPRRVCKVFVT